MPPSILSLARPMPAEPAVTAFDEPSGSLNVPFSNTVGRPSKSGTQSGGLTEEAGQFAWPLALLRNTVSLSLLLEKSGAKGRVAMEKGSRQKASRGDRGPSHLALSQGLLSENSPLGLAAT